MIIEPPLNAQPQPDKEADILERTKSYARWTEKVIRRHPEQWTWLHNRWKTKPLKDPKQ